MSDTVKVPGAGPIRKRYVYAVAGVAAAYVGWRWWKARTTPAAPVDAQLDTGSTTDSGVVGAPAAGNTQYAQPDTSTGTAILTNDAWTAKAMESLGSVWNEQTIATICGKILADVPLTASESVIAQAIIASAGRPPVGDHPIRHAATSTPVPGPPPVPTNVHVQPSDVKPTSLVATFNWVTGATSYEGTLDGRSIHTSTTNRIPFTGLRKNTPYRIMVRAKNSHGASPWGETFATTAK